MRENQEAFPVTKICQALKVSPSGYFSWLHRVPSRRATENERLLERIQVIHQETRKTYGSPRITDCLKDEGIMVSRPRIARIMRKNGISASIKRRFRVTTDSGHDLPIAPNLLNRNFTTDQPGKVWTSDITYVAVQEGWLYLTVVEDLFNREIVGWSMSNGLRAAETTIPALIQACIRQKPKPGLIFHSDRGIQYACDDFRELLNNHQMIQSMSGTGNCYDNAVTESFFGTFKKDLIYRIPIQPTLKARQEIFKYIEMFYNRTRKHSTNGNLSPVQFSLSRQAA
ncbi:MAG: IS3 family transposase [bacterium]|nr:IS3 family transposase [bacterium]